MSKVIERHKKKILPVKYKVMADSIRTGKINATLLSDLIIITDVRDRRQAHLMIEELINKYGYTILANKTGENKGYYYPANEHEFINGIKPFESNIKSMEKRHKNLNLNYYNK